LIIVDDRSKIENLPKLSDLSLNQNPLGTIPPFNDSKIKSLSLQDTSLRSAKFPSSYVGSVLRTISLSNNEIRSINEDDFVSLKTSKVTKLTIDIASLSIIDQNAFSPLIELQALSLQNNQLKSCKFLPIIPVLASIKLDRNQFTSLPQELLTPGNIKSFFFTYNSISIIDESSPLYTWMKKNYTNIKVYLANNPFNCCQSLWFIRFLKISPQFVGDASLLKCASPSNYAGQLLIHLNPDKMNCGGAVSRWTTAWIIGIIVGGLVIGLALIIVIIIFHRRGRSRSGYTEIDGIDDPSPNAPLLPSNEPPLPFPPHAEDNDDGMSTYSTAVTVHTTGSQAPTHSTAGGVSVIDDNRI
jgi:hypothetical protein